MKSTFGDILKAAIDKVPGSVGGALAAGDGETVDSYTSWDTDEWALLTAHVGILVSHLRRSLHTFHFGDVQFIQMAFRDLEVAIQIVDQEYYVLLALTPPVRLGIVRRHIQLLSKTLREEML